LLLLDNRRHIQRTGTRARTRAGTETGAETGTGSSSSSKARERDSGPTQADGLRRGSSLFGAVPRAGSGHAADPGLRVGRVRRHRPSADPKLPADGRRERGRRGGRASTVAPQGRVHRGNHAGSRDPHAEEKDRSEEQAGTHPNHRFLSRSTGSGQPLRRRRVGHPQRGFRPHHHPGPGQHLCSFATVFFNFACFCVL